MDKFSSYISVVLKGVHMSDVARKDLEDEILDHLEMLKNEYKNEGFSEDQAELKATQTFGATDDINKKLKKVNAPYNRFISALKPKAILRESFQWAVCIVATFIISLSINSFAFAGTEVKQCSMQNTLFEGQRLVENKLVYHYSTPKRGDIVIIDEVANKGIIDTFFSNVEDMIDKFSSKQEEDHSRLIKRVIGVPGDHIDIKNGKVYLNGNLLKEAYVKGKTLPNSTEFPITIPQNEYFVMGDNREVSLDSRDIGLIYVGRIEGKAVLRVWPFSQIGSISDIN